MLVTSIALWSCSTSSLSHGSETGTLELTVLDAVTKEELPARIELQASDGKYYVASDGLLVGGDCDMSDEGAGLVDLQTTLDSFSRQLENPYRNSLQFYSEGKSSIELPEGTASIRIYKGPEYNAYQDTVDIQAGRVTQLRAGLTRWINMPAQGWYSSDDHLHIPRPVKELNPFISKMMQAEDIHVANLLQMGKVANFNIAKQYAHGRGSYYREGDYILAAGQENPRTHFLGHAITLGAQTEINFPEKYLIYRLVWEKAVAQGGINGFAHAIFPRNTWMSPRNGLAVMLPQGLVHFIEVLQFNRANYASWYDVLNLGFKVAPTAGTDYPCGDQNIPGHERFYAKVEGDFNYESWLDAVKGGRTFVTTGPMLDFKVDGFDIGSKIKLKKPSSVHISGTVSTDPDRSRLGSVEIVQNGEVIHQILNIQNKGRIDFSFDHPIEKSSWLAVRGYGENPKDAYQRFAQVKTTHFQTFEPGNLVHSAPIYVSIAGSPAIEKSPKSKEIASAWLAQLGAMEEVLDEANIDALAEELASPNFDAVPKEVLVSSRPELLKEVKSAKAYFARILE